MKKLFDRQNEEQLIEDFKRVISDTEVLLKETANSGDAKLTEVRSRVENSILDAKSAIGEAKIAIIAEAMDVAKEMNVYAHANPWRSIGFAASIGAIIGLLIGRRH